MSLRRPTGARVNTRVQCFARCLQLHRLARDIVHTGPNINTLNICARSTADDPTVSKPDEVFSGGNNLGGFAVGDDNGVRLRAHALACCI